MSSAVEGVDIHAHAVPAKFLEDAQKSHSAGVTVETSDGKFVVTFPGGKPLRPIGGNMTRFADRLGWLDEQLMRHQMVGPWLDVMGQVLPAPAGQAWIRNLNDSLAEAVKEAGGRLSAHASLHLADPAGAASELDRAATELGMNGCMIPTNIPDAHLSESRFDAVWEVAQARQVPVMLHPPTVAPSMCLFGEFPESAFYGRLVDTTLVATQLIVSGVFDRFPDLRLVLVHGGGFLPYQTGRFDSSFADKKLGPAGLMPVDYVKRFYFDTVLMSAPALVGLFELVGAGRVMIGSDHAAQPSERQGRKLTDSLDATGLDEPSRQLVLHENADSVFHTAAS